MKKEWKNAIKKRALTAIFILAIISMPSSVGYLHQAGVCLATRSVLSEQQLVEDAIEALLTQYPPSFYRTDRYVRVSRDWSIPPVRVDSYVAPPGVFRYLDVSQFMRMNPGCCRVVTPKAFEQRPASTWEQLTGQMRAFVEIHYRVPYVEAGVAKEEKFMALLKLDNCGRANFNRQY